ncbi:Antiviral helicase [Komagataella phaffii CBS 7435]|uniref:RNA helicase n=2 Tax=Komagataella phaffii TaxID=460519 RepID=C4R1I3_KOMPG|nr:Putative RNA helicase [Komagataella phaffii GS115]AOA62913.1 GQ67_00775T0 [Komagataella phaffii]CAH2448112.1 Antiviral helicase [Komagataella phaffii CBS 7435]AOA67182.1 GQ68_00614T0 [Komagataella phaffii GS115]CAY69357.1 Putative RNA helicase [Komagataella phaffii GS115]CCA38257.1 Antiviral helicase [Komagataella phaffii CBS 7435]
MREIDDILQEIHDLSLNKVDLPPDTQTKFQFPSVTEEEEINDLKKQYLTPSDQIPPDLLKEFLIIPDESDQKLKFYQALVKIPPFMDRTKIKFKRKGIEGKIVGYEEALDLSGDNLTSSNSFSLHRKPAENGSSIRGQTTNLPFLPGGLVSKAVKDTESINNLLHRDDQGLFDIPLGFERGLQLEKAGDTELVDELSKLPESNEETLENQIPSGDVELLDPETLEEDAIQEGDEIDALLPSDISFSKRPKTERPQAARQWAHLVDLDHKLENFHELVPNMARTWPFELDTFQQEAIYHLEKGDSVFVAAHTSAGKTVVAEYVIAMANINMTKAIYTSPIKALSNQKFRDFKHDFEDIDVGLITGDVQINQEANCLIMTTEILRSMLYRGADVIRDVEFVIFDEVHYVNDIDRGVVWEEVIIMLPEHVKIVMLSATVPNTMEFASWVGRTKQKDVYVISTPKRPIPLEIFVWAKSDLFKVVDSNRNFLEKNFQAHSDVLVKPKKEVTGSQAGNRGGRGNARGASRGGRGSSSTVSSRGRGGSANVGTRFTKRDGPNKKTWTNLVQYLRSHDLLPSVIFVFSKARCEEYADSLQGVNFCTGSERSRIHMFIDKAVSRLKKEDRELPQIMKMREMLSRGIAVHHGGLLPIMKEVIEILFAKTLIKVLFATETFAMGLNLPTRTVVFSELRKHDGTGFRNLLPGEFTQMSGRAGRRGLDTTGTVIVMSYNEPLESKPFQQITLGVPTKLVSQFRLTYNMILNLLRIEALRVEEMIKRSFSENTTQSGLKENEKEIIELQKKIAEISQAGCQECDPAKLKEFSTAICDYTKLTGELIRLSLEIPLHRKRFRRGMLFIYTDADGFPAPAFLYDIKMSDSLFVALVFDIERCEENNTGLPYIPESPSFIKNTIPKWKFKGNFRFTTIPFNKVQYVTRFVLQVLLKSIIRMEPESIEKAEEQILQLLHFYKKFEEYNWSASLTIPQNDLYKKIQDYRKIIANAPVIQCPSLREHYIQIKDLDSLRSRLITLKSLVSDDNMTLLPDYEQRLKVLNELEFVDDHLNVVLKGRIACEINSGWELALTELLLDNFLADFDPEEIVALLSAFVYEGRTRDDEEPALTPRLEKGKAKIRDIVSHLLEIFQDKQVSLSAEEESFLEAKRFNLVNVVYEWAKGTSFSDIMKLSSEAEGTIVRVITRLDEVCREVKSAALIIGDSALHDKMSEAQEKIKRDIVFCASLYL